MTQPLNSKAESTLNGFSNVGYFSSASELQHHEEGAAMQLAKSLKPTDSIKLLKDRLVLDKGYSEEAARNVINKMQNTYGYKLSPDQENEIGALSDPTRPSLSDVFFGDARFTNWTTGNLIK